MTRDDEIVLRPRRCATCEFWLAGKCHVWRDGRAMPATAYACELYQKRRPEDEGTWREHYSG